MPHLVAFLRFSVEITLISPSRFLLTLLKRKVLPYLPIFLEQYFPQETASVCLHVTSTVLGLHIVDLFLLASSFLEVFESEKNTASILSLLKISKPKSIEGKIDNALTEATNLLIADREKLFNELKKLNSVADSDQKLVQSSLNIIKKKLKI